MGSNHCPVGDKPRRIMILTTTTGYQTRAFVDAAGELGLEAALGTDRCHVLEDPWSDGAIPLRFEDPNDAALRIVEYARERPVQAIVALGDAATPVAARACQALGLAYHSAQGADICRDKYRSRKRLRDAGLQVPEFVRFPLDSNPHDAVHRAAPGIGFPCVVKPLALSASRGVIRADNPDQFVESFERIRKLLRSPGIRVLREDTSGYIQVEQYVDGAEIAVEGLVIRGQPKILAVFDKPQPLEGPFFEETIYVTPSRLPARCQDAVRITLERAISALELFHGPFHAELRINRRGVWPLEVAARSIGGLCSRALRFRSPPSGNDISLERLILALAAGDDVSAVEREKLASGVMMIPVAQEGVYEDVEGVDKAREVAGIEDIIITAKPGQLMIPWPEGCSYPGFIFARASTPELVEQALNEAHARLRFRISPALPVVTVS